MSEPGSPSGREARPDRSDELLDDPPRGDWHLGRLAGYRAGARVRRRIAAVLLLAGVSAAVVAWRYAREREHARTHPYELPEGTDVADRPRELLWSAGKARLGLSREPPGVELIRLPDRDIRLAEGCDAAQIQVEVVDGRTVSLETVSGEIVETPR